MLYGPVLRPLNFLHIELLDSPVEEMNSYTMNSLYRKVWAGRAGGAAFFIKSRGCVGRSVGARSGAFPR